MNIKIFRVRVQCSPCTVQYIANMLGLNSGTYCAFGDVYGMSVDTVQQGILNMLKSNECSGFNLNDIQVSEY